MICAVLYYVLFSSYNEEFCAEFEHITPLLKDYFIEKNINSRIIVPMNAVETYDGDFHSYDIMSQAAFYIMGINYIELVKAVE